MAQSDLSPSMLPPDEGEGGDQLTDAELRALIERARADVADTEEQRSLTEFKGWALEKLGAQRVDQAQHAPPELLETQVPVGMHNDTSTGTWDPSQTMYWSQSRMGEPMPAPPPGCIFCGASQIAVPAMGRKGALHGMCESCAAELEKKLGLMLDRMEPQA